MMRSELLRQGIVFFFIGISGLCINYGLFYMFLMVHVPYLVASALGYLCGMPYIYFCNRIFTFKSEVSYRSSVGTFVAVYLGSLVCGLILLFSLVTVLHVPVLIANAVTIIGTAVLNFLGMKVFAFRNTIWH